MYLSDKQRDAALPVVTSVEHTLQIVLLYPWAAGYLDNKFIRKAMTEITEQGLFFHFPLFFNVRTSF